MMLYIGQRSEVLTYVVGGMTATKFRPWALFSRWEERDEIFPSDRHLGNCDYGFAVFVGCSFAEVNCRDTRSM